MVPWSAIAALVKIYSGKLPGRAPLCNAVKDCRRKAFVFLVQKPLLRRAEVLLVAWGFSVPWFGVSRNRRSGRFPIWWVRAQGFEP